MFAVSVTEVLTGTEVPLAVKFVIQTLSLVHVLPEEGVLVGGGAKVLVGVTVGVLLGTTVVVLLGRPTHVTVIVDEWAEFVLLVGLVLRTAVYW